MARRAILTLVTALSTLVGSALAQTWQPLQGPQTHRTITGASFQAFAPDGERLGTGYFHPDGRLFLARPDGSQFRGRWRTVQHGYCALWQQRLQAGRVERIGDPEACYYLGDDRRGSFAAYDMQSQQLITILRQRREGLGPDLARAFGLAEAAAPSARLPPPAAARPESAQRPDNPDDPASQLIDPDPDWLMTNRLEPLNADADACTIYRNVGQGGGRRGVFALAYIASLPEPRARVQIQVVAVNFDWDTVREPVLRIDGRVVARGDEVYGTRMEFLFDSRASLIEALRRGRRAEVVAGGQTILTVGLDQFSWITEKAAGFCGFLSDQRR